MTNEDMHKTMQFIVEQPANFAVRLQSLEQIALIYSGQIAAHSAQIAQHSAEIGEISTQIG